MEKDGAPAFQILDGTDRVRAMFITGLRYVSCAPASPECLVGEVTVAVGADPETLVVIVGGTDELPMTTSIPSRIDAVTADHVVEVLKGWGCPFESTPAEALRAELQGAAADADAAVSKPEASVNVGTEASDTSTRIMQWLSASSGSSGASLDAMAAALESIILSTWDCFDRKLSNPSFSSLKILDGDIMDSTRSGPSSEQLPDFRAFQVCCATCYSLVCKSWHRALQGERTAAEVGSVVSYRSKPRVVNAALAALSKHYAAGKLQSLRVLDLQNCRGLTDSALGSSFTVPEAAAPCPISINLTAVNLGYCPRVSDTGVIEFAQRCTSLRALSLLGNNAVTDDGIIGLIQACPQLEVLHLRGCKMLTAASAEALASGKHLQVLNLSYLYAITDRELALLMKGCRKLVALNLSFCLAVTKAGLDSIASECRGLTHLNVTGLGASSGSSSSAADSAGSIAAPALCSLLTHLTRLEGLSMASCADAVDDTVLAVLAAAGRCCLRELDLRGARKLTSMSVASCFASGMGSQLTNIVLSGCWRLTDVAVIAVVWECPKLLFLDVESCDRLTDVSLYHLCAKLGGLKGLDVRNTGSGITASALQLVGQSCLQLQHYRVPSNAVFVGCRCCI